VRTALLGTLKIERLESQIIKNFGSNKTKGPKQDIIAFSDCSSRSRSLQLCFLLLLNFIILVFPHSQQLDKEKKTALLKKRKNTVSMCVIIVHY
jgi:hypothetical protein